MKEIKWRKDSDGDWVLEYKGDYIGLVCPGDTKNHSKSRFLYPVAAWDDKHMCFKTVKEAKKALEGVAKGELELQLVPTKARFRYKYE